MKYNFERGTYSPSLMAMELNIFDEFSTLENLSENKLSLFFHEYFHFIQDVTSPFSFYMMWNTYSGFRGVISNAQRSEKNFKIPLESSKELDDLKKNSDLKDAIMFDNFPDFKGLKRLSNLNIKDVQLIARPGFEDEESKGVLFVKESLDDKNGSDGEFYFGAIAVIETMTFLAQKKFFPAPPVPDYPYKSGIFLTNYMLSYVLSEECVFFLCDLALHTSIPGRFFYEILVELENNKFEPKNAEELYEFCLPILIDKWDIWNFFNQCKEGLLENINQVFGHDVFNHNKEWFNALINEGFNLRMKDPFLMLKIYRQNVPFDEFLTDLYIKLGTPELINLDNIRWFAAPKALRGNEENIFPGWLTAFMQVKTVLATGECKCELLKYCKGSSRKMPVNEDCETKPWAKINDEPLCPFAAVWTSFGLPKL